LRNTIGFGWHPATGELWGVDHGIDWLGDNAQIEELNRIEQGKLYGWPYIYGMGEFNPQDDPPGGITLEQWRDMSESPVLGYTAHAAPMQMAFYAGSSFPAEYQGDAFVAMRGSWNRKPPSGYEVVRVRFDGGKPKSIEPFITGFLVEDGKEGPGYLGRLAGVAVARDGALLVSDDSNGVIYRVTYDGPRESHAEPARKETAEKRPDGQPSKTPPASEIAIRLLKAKQQQPLQVQSSVFAANEKIPLAYSAYGDDASPPLSWSGAPEGTRSFVLILDDPDASSAKPFTHWIAYNIPAEVKSLREGLPPALRLEDPAGVLQGQNTRGSSGYFGMKPPPGDPPHRYHFQVFALDRMLDLKPGASREEVLAAMKGHVLAEGELVGTFDR
jgi:Raf kinase inhibitor-like YbhB/YbcL family protein